MEESGDDIIGILLAKDLLKYCYNKNTHNFQVADILRPAVFVPQGKRLNVLLREFRVNHNHLAIVIDEYGHVVGLVTIEDVLDQIVGEIEDEYDIDENGYIKQRDDGSYTVKATTPIKEFNDSLGTKFNHEKFSTIGDVILKGFDHLPARGETLILENLQFKVLHADSRRIHLLEVKQER